MSAVPVWRLFAYMNDNDGDTDEHRVVPEWRLEDTLRWCVTRGYDHIYLCRDSDTAVFERKPPSGLVVHSGGSDDGVRLAG